MTDEQIIKALECHNGCRGSICEECPLFPTNECSAELSGYALDLINRQKAEIERLNKEVADVVEVVHGHWKGIELKDTCSVCNRSISEICDANSYIEIEVLSELIACPFCGAKMDDERRSENG